MRRACRCCGGGWVDFPKAGLRVGLVGLFLLEGSSTSGKSWRLWSWPGFLDLDPIGLTGGRERVP